MKKLLFILLFCLSGCAVKSVEQQVALHEQAFVLLGAKILELEALVKPEKAKRINEALARGEIRLDLPVVGAEKK